MSCINRGTTPYRALLLGRNTEPNLMELLVGVANLAATKYLLLPVGPTWYNLKGLADPILDGFILACGVSAYATQKQVDQHDKAYVQRQTRERSMRLT
ncbi:hypothetical protein B566_EDAN004871 [Ephemera danica]|nr:hypothetical protein B566_EDAN004871 [Ephemera danica]